MSEKYVLITRQNVIEMVGAGWSYDLIACGSKQFPRRDSARRINSGDFANVMHFEWWHIRTKNRICNEIDGKTLKYYLVIPIMDEEVESCI